MSTHLGASMNRFIAAFALCVALPTLAWAGEAEAEAYRLHQEIGKLAQRNAWSGVERTFLALVEVGLPMTLEDYQLGGLAAMQRGEMLEAKIRLQKARQAGEPVLAAGSPYQEVERTLEELDSRYGMVHLMALGDALPVLVRDDAPFSTNEKQAITWARQRVSENRAFMGLLPIGGYRLDSALFTVEAGAEMLEVRLGEM